MANHERPNLKQIRIKADVCDRLDKRKGKDDSYTDVIKALLDENDRLLERNVELERDKEQFRQFLQAQTFVLDIKDATPEEIEQSKNKLKDAGFNVAD